MGKFTFTRTEKCERYFLNDGITPDTLDRYMVVSGTGRYTGRAIMPVRRHAN